MATHPSILAWKTPWTDKPGGPRSMGHVESDVTERLILPLPRGERPLVELYLEPGVFSERCTEKLPLRVDFIHRVEFGDHIGCR